MMTGSRLNFVVDGPDGWLVIQKLKVGDRESNDYLSFIIIMRMINLMDPLASDGSL